MPEDNISFTVIPLVQMGATEPALAQLRKDYDGGDRSYFFLMDPLLAPLRTQPGWVDILKRAGLIDYWRRSKEPPEFCKAANPPPVCRTI